MPPARSLPCDEDLLRRLALPLAQLYRRAHNAKSALERHQAAYYLWEASLRLLASAALVEYAELPEKDAEISGRLKMLARPSLGHWWEAVRRIVPLLADAGDPGFAAARDLILGRVRDDLPRAAGLDAVLRETLEGEAPPGGQTAVRLTELFDRMVKYRNRELGHGAAGQRSSVHYDKLGRAILLGVSEVLARLDVLAGRRLILVDEVRRDESGAWLVGRCELVGESARRLDPLELPRSDALRLPDPGKAYLLSPGGGLRTLQPLLVFDAEADEVFFLSARRGEKRAELLSYTSGRVLEREGAGSEVALFLERVLGAPVAAGALEEWAARSRAEDPASASAEPASRPERRIGGFELLSRIGRGGMGVVYRAWQQSLGRQVALKCLLRSGDPKAEARFAREIRSLGRVEHPNLVKIFTSGSEADHWFYAMELIEGADLASICESLAGTSASDVSDAAWKRALTTACDEARRREERLTGAGGGGEAAAIAAGAPQPQPQPPQPPQPPPPSSETSATSAHSTSLLAGEGHIAHAVEVVRQAASAAHALHEAGIVHRDIKPGNIMVTRDGSHAVLMDLGLAQLTDDAHGRLTHTRQFVGTLRYASPEQVLAAGALDRRSDVYSLGATLWELLALRPLFGAGEATPTPDLMLKIQSEEPGSPRRLNPRVPADLDAIVLKCLEKDRARRYATAGDLAEDLARWQRGDVVLAQPPSLRYLLGKYARRHRTELLVASALLIAALGGTGLAFYRIERSRSEAVAAQKATETALFDMYTALGLEANAAGEPARALLWFTNAASLAREDVERQRSNRVRIRSWSREVPRPVRAFLTSRGTRWMSFDPTGAYLLTLPENDDDGASIFALEKEEPLRLPALATPVSCAAWSPDGRRLALGRPNGSVDLVGIPDGGSAASFGALGRVEAVAYSPDGRFLAASGNGVILWDCAANRLAAELNHPQRVRRLTFSPGSDRLATGCDDRLARVFAIPPPAVGAAPLWTPVPHQTGNLVHPWALPEILFLDGGRRLMTASKRSGASVWDAGNGSPLFTIEPHGYILGLSASPDGRYTVVRDRLEAQIWDAVTGRKVGSFAYPSHDVAAVAFSPDGAVLLTTEGDLRTRLWTIGAAWRPLATVDPLGDLREIGRISHSQSVARLAWSPDGRHFATAQYDGLVQVWRPGEPRESERHLPYVSIFCEVAATADGERWMPIGRRFECPFVATRVYEISTGKPCSPYLACGGILTGGSFSPDGRLVLTINSRAPHYEERNRSEYRPAERAGQTRLWDWKSGKEVWPALDLDSEPLTGAFSHDGELAVVLCASGAVACIDLGRGEVIRKLDHGARLDALPSDPMGEVLFVPDGRSFMTAGAGSTVRVWERDGRLIRDLQHEGKNCYDVALSPDGSLLATATSGSLATVWDWRSGQRAASLRHPNRVSAVSFSPDARRLLTACDDGQARLWDWQRGSLACAPLTCGGAVSAVRYSIDGRFVLTSTLEGTFRGWEIQTGRPVTPAKPLDFSGYQILLVGRSTRPATMALVPQSYRASFFDLADLDDDGREPLEPSTLRLLGEVNSGQRLHDAGAGVVNLGAPEWLERWNALRQALPDEGAAEWTAESRRAWHRRQAEVREQWLQWDAATWHLDRLEALGERVPPERRASLRAFVRSWRFSPLTAPWADMESFVAMDPDRLHAIEATALTEPLVRSPGPRVDISTQLAPDVDIAGYAVRAIVADRPTRVRVLAGSDDALRLWLNGKLIIEARLLRPAVPDEDQAIATLVAGENRIVAEVSQAHGGWALYLRLEDESGRRLWLKDDGTLEPLP